MKTVSDSAFLTKDEVIVRLKACGITPTQQRVEIAQLLFDRPQHLSADQVLGVVNARDTVVSKATVYNTLGLFARKMLVREIVVDPAKIFYDSNTHPHHHFYNVDTGRLMDIDAGEVSLNGMPNLPADTEADGVDIIVRIHDVKS